MTTKCYSFPNFYIFYHLSLKDLQAGSKSKSVCSQLNCLHNIFLSTCTLLLHCRNLSLKFELNNHVVLVYG